METLACTLIILPVLTLFFAWNSACELWRLDERGSGRKTANSAFDRLEERGSGRRIVQLA
jgi:hypothetical protein